jgi:hypothetical protein
MKKPACQCRVCGGNMYDGGEALEPTFSTSVDGTRSQIPAKTAKMVEVRKCEDCGHSFLTPDNLNQRC